MCFRKGNWNRKLWRRTRVYEDYVRTIRKKPFFGRVDTLRVQTMCIRGEKRDKKKNRKDLPKAIIYRKRPLSITDAVDG